MPADVQLLDQTEALIDEFQSYLELIRVMEVRIYFDFISAPTHKAPKGLADLAMYLHGTLREDISTFLNNEDLMQQYSDGQGADSANARLAGIKEQVETLIELTKLFIVYQQVLNDKSIYFRALVKGLKERNNNELFLKAAADFRVNLNKRTFTLMVAEDKWWLEHQSYYHKYTEQGTDSKIFERNIHAFDSFSQLAILRNYLELLNRNVIDENMAKLFHLSFNEIVEEAENHPPLVNLYISMIRLLKDKESLPGSNYSDFKTYFQKKEYELARVDQLVLSKTCCNYLFEIYFRHGSPWLNEAFEWMKYISRKKLYAFDGAISDDEYLNFYLIAKALNEKDELDYFEQFYTKLLDKSIKEQVVSLCKAYTLHREGKIDAAFELLNANFPLHSKKYFKYDIRVKELRVMLCYENMVIKKKDGLTLEDLEKSLDNLNKYCNRLINGEYLIKEKVDGHVNFHKIANYLYLFHGKVNEREKKSTLKKIDRQLNSNKPLSNRSWIIKQREQLR